jgi:arylsulfatase A-like enzyme
LSGYDGPVTDNSPLRSGKGSLYEGGIRVPLIVRWPGVTPAASVCSEPVVLTDLFSTCLSAANIAPPETMADGIDLTPLLKDPAAKLDRAALYFHYPHYYHNTTPVGAVRTGKWKLLEYFEDGRLELFNLADDLSEKTDLAKQLPDKAAQLREMLRSWRSEVGAAMPRENPQFSAGKK